MEGFTPVLLRPQKGDTLWRAVFLAGLMNQRLLVGATLFGIGWGLVGFCPGPAMTALVSGHPEALIFFTAMVTGMYAHRTVDLLAEIRTPTGSMSDG